MRPRPKPIGDRTRAAVLPNITVRDTCAYANCGTTTLLDALPNASIDMH